MFILGRCVLDANSIGDKSRWELRLPSFEDTPGALVVSVESTFRRLRCAQCGFKCHRCMTAAPRRSGTGGVGAAYDVGVAAAQDGVRQLRQPVRNAFEGALTARSGGSLLTPR